jgi:hypothetical protein
MLKSGPGERQAGRGEIAGRLAHAIALECLDHWRATTSSGKDRLCQALDGTVIAADKSDGQAAIAASPRRSQPRRGNPSAHLARGFELARLSQQQFALQGWRQALCLPPEALRLFSKALIEADRLAEATTLLHCSTVLELVERPGALIDACRQVAPVEPPQAHRKLPQVVSGTADGQFPRATQRIRSMPPKRRYLQGIDR